MHKALQTAFVVAIVSVGILASNAQAMTLTTPAALHSDAARAAVIRKVVSVCGTNGCAPVQTKRIYHQKPGSIAAKHI